MSDSTNSFDVLFNSLLNKSSGLDKNGGDKIYKRELLIEKIDDKHPINLWTHVSDLAEELNNSISINTFIYDSFIINELLKQNENDMLTFGSDGSFKIKEGWDFNAFMKTKKD